MSVAKVIYMQIATIINSTHRETTENADCSGFSPSSNPVANLSGVCVLFMSLAMEVRSW